MPDILTTTRATKAGAYIGRIFRPTPNGTAAFARLPCIVGKGSRLQTVFNAPIRRSYRNAVGLSFSGTSPHIATLAFPAQNDQNIARVYKSNGQTVSQNFWSFTESVLDSGTFDQVLIVPDVFDANAVYLIDYQSTSTTIKDELPFSELREIRFIGDTENQERYTENLHYTIPISLSPVLADTDNANDTVRAFTSVTAGVGNTGTAVMTISAGTFTGDYNRIYTATVTAVGVTVDVDVRVTLGSGGNAVEAPSPIHTSLTVPGGLVANFPTPGGTSTDTITDPETGDVITLQLADSGADVTVGDTFTFTGLGTSLIEVDGALSNTNQFPEFSAVTETVTNASVSLTIRDDSAYSALSNRNYIVQCTAAAGVSPVRTATFVWVGYGEHPSTQGTFSIAESTSSNLNVTIENGIKVDMSFGTVQFVVGDKFTFTAKAPRKFITAKDSRDYTLTVQASSAGTVQFQYVTNTPEGRFGLINSTGPGGSLRLPGGIDLFVRNIGTATAQNRYAVNDAWTFSTVDEETVDWTLRTRTSETISTTEFMTDVLGLVTGTVGATYVIINNIPTDVLYIKDTVTSTLLTATALTTQPIIFFLTAPTNSIEISYEYSGIEPAPGQFYYVTANIVRPVELYNTPILSLTYDEASRLLGPSATDNDLLIGAELVLQDNGAPGIYTCQARDADGDGIVSTTDINTAILATERNAKLTDVIVLNGNSSMSTALSSNERMNDPFERKERALWQGLPIGTVIGGTNVPGSITFVAQKTLQVYGDNHAHGTRVLLANNRATKTITLTDGTQTTVTLDGSFIAAAVAGFNASFADPGATLLRQFISGFDSMNVYSEPEELQLVAASALFLSNQGSADAPRFRLEDSVTVDRSSSDNNELSVAINQRQYVTRTVRESMDANLVGFVPPSEQAGVALVQTFLVQLLAGLVGSGIIAPYTDENGNSRNINPSSDIEVFRDSSDKTLYNFKYYWNARYPVKRLFGLYSVDRKQFTQQ